MKTSHKLLITTAGIIIALLVVGLIFLRTDVQNIMAQSPLKYEEVPVGKFDGLNFSDKWMVKVRQGREHKVQVASDGTLRPLIENIQGTLYFKIDTANLSEANGTLYVKVTAPSLQSIRAGSGTEIEVKNFQSDSLTVVMENSGVFTGDNNHFNYSSYKTTGVAWLKFMRDDM